MSDPAFQAIRQHVPAKTLGITLPPGYYVLAAGSQLFLCFGEAELRSYSTREDLKQIETDAVRHAARQYVPSSEEQSARDRTGVPWTSTVSAKAAQLAVAHELHAICIHLTGLETLIKVRGYQALQSVLRQTAQALKWLLNEDEYLTRLSADKLLIFTTRSRQGVETLIDTVDQEIASVAVEAAGRRLPQRYIGHASTARVDDPAKAAAVIEALVISAVTASAEQRHPAEPTSATPESPANQRRVESVEPPEAVEPPLPSGAGPGTALAEPTPERAAPDVPSPSPTAAAEPLDPEVQLTPSLSALPVDAPEVPSRTPPTIEPGVSGLIEPIQPPPESEVIESVDSAQVLEKDWQDRDVGADDAGTSIDHREIEGAPSAAPGLTAAPSAESIVQPTPAAPLASDAPPATTPEGPTPAAVAPKVPSNPSAGDWPAAMASDTALSLQRKLLGEMLVQAKLITEAELDEALAEQERTGQRLGHILVSRGFISRQLLAQFLKVQRDIPYIDSIDLSTRPIDAQLVRRVPEWVIRQHKVLPIARVGDEVHLAMLDPTDVVAMDLVRQFLGARVQPFLITKGDFDRARAQLLEVGHQRGLEPEPATVPELPHVGPSAQSFEPPAPVQPPLPSGASAAGAGPAPGGAAAASETPSPMGQAIHRQASGPAELVQVSPEAEDIETADSTRVHGESQPDQDLAAEAAETDTDQWEAEGDDLAVESAVPATESVAASGPTPEQAAPEVPSAGLPSESSDVSVAGSRVAPRKLLGEMLVQAGLITEAQLREALTVQQQTGARLGQILIERGYISRQTLGEILEGQRGLGYINLSTSPIDEELVRRLPEWVILQHKVLPFARVGNEIHLAMLDPTDVVALDTVGEFLGGRARPFLTTEVDFDWALTKFFGVGRKVGQNVIEFEPEDVAQRKAGAVTITESPDSPPIIRVLNSIISDAVRTGATDIHIEPGAEEARVRFRIDGLLYDKVVLPSGVAEAVGSRIKVLAGMDIAERVASQDGRMLLNLDGHEFDLRIATVGSAFGERVAIRLLNPQRLLLGTDHLGLFPEQEQLLNRVLDRPYGMILVTGPTGSGKTTTLYAAMTKLNTRSHNIMTIEDPVEYRLEGITQIPVREKMRVTFSMGLRAILRQDPDVVMVGEIRDTETASIAVQAALTGHLVLSTLHTNNAAGALVRLLEMGTQPYLLTSSVLAVLGQRLIRMLCPACKRPTRPTEADFQMLGIPPSDDVSIFEPVGCPDCDHLGYKGRTGVFEIMVMTDALRDLVLERQSEAAMMKVAKMEGMATMQESAVRAVLAGTTSIDALRELIVAKIG